MNISRICRYDDSSYFQKDGETREEWRRRLKADIDKDKENMTAEESAAHNKKMEEFNKLLSSNKANSVTVEDANKLLDVK